MNKDELIKSNERINKINRDVKNELESESDHICMICQNEVTSFCESHSVPKTVFNHMNLENGELIPLYNAARAKILTKVETGKNNSGIFKLICRPCDQKYFSILDNFDLINGKWNNELLKLQAQRINLYHIYRLKEHSYSLYKIFEGLLDSDRVEKEKNYVNEQVKYYKDLFSKYNIDNSEKFNIIYDDILEYETNFTTVCKLSVTFNPCLDFMLSNKRASITKFESREIEKDSFFTIIDMDEKQNNDMYVLVLPYNGKTRVTLFCDSNSICDILVKVDFNNFSREKKLLFISSSLIIYGRNIYGNKKFMEEYRKAGNIFNMQFFRKYDGKEIPEKSIFEVKEAYLYIYDNDINIFKK